MDLQFSGNELLVMISALEEQIDFLEAVVSDRHVNLVDKIESQKALDYSRSALEKLHSFLR